MAEPNQPPSLEEPNHKPPGLRTLTGRLLRSGLGALQNRGELLVLEWQEEKARMTELLVWTVGLIFLAMMALALVTLAIVLLFPEHLRLYAVAGFALLYILGTVGAWLGVKSLLKREPFAETMGQAKKDAEWLDSLR